MTKDLRKTEIQNGGEIKKEDLILGSFYNEE